MDLFKPKTERIEKLATLESKAINELTNIFNKKTNIYIDFGNVYRWVEKLEWHIDLKRLKQFFDGFKEINKVYLYNGTFSGSKSSYDIINQAQKYNYELVTKPVKTIEHKIDVSSIPPNSPSIIEQFIKKNLLIHLDLQTVELLNNQLKQLNKKGITLIEEHKCNFDVEIAMDIISDCITNKVENFVLWSGDSDFADVINRLKKNNKGVCIFGTSRRISTELAETHAYIFDIKKLRNFICWPREIPPEILEKLAEQNAKGTS